VPARREGHSQTKRYRFAVLRKDYGTSSVLFLRLNCISLSNMVVLSFAQYVPQEVAGSKQTHIVPPYRSFDHIIDALNFKGVVNYWPQNPVTTLCLMIFAPPLDMLKRPADLASIKKKKSDGNGNSGAAIMYRNSRYWICLHNLKLWFFQYYTDAYPRFGSDLSAATVNIIHDKGHPTSLVNLVHLDLRAWILEFSSRKDAKNFCLALHEAQKALNNESIYVNADDAQDDLNFGFPISIN
jgi:hypothetical protein